MKVVIASSNARLIKVVLLFFSLLPVSAVAHAKTEILAEGRALLQERQADAAYELLQEHLMEYAGDPEFDYLLGLAALGKGDAPLAIFALERAVASKPDFGGARMDLGRAYFEAGEYSQASYEFNALMALDPPPQVRRAVALYRDRIRSRTQPARRFFGRIELGGGYDNNANNATDLEEFLVAGQTAALSEEARRQASTVNQANVVLGLQQPVGALSWDTSFNVLRRQYPDADFVNTQGLQLRSGLSWKKGPRLHRLIAALMRTEADGKENSRSRYVVLDNSVALDGRNRVGLALYAAAQRHPAEYRYRDVNQGQASVSWQNKPGETLDLQVGLKRGRDNPVGTNPKYGKHTRGAHGALSWRPGRQHTLRLAGQVTSQHYDGVFFATERRQDVMRSLDFSWEWRLDRYWSARPEAAWVKNSTQDEIFAFEKRRYVMNLAYQF